MSRGVGHCRGYPWQYCRVFFHQEGGAQLKRHFFVMPIYSLLVVSLTCARRRGRGGEVVSDSKGAFILQPTSEIERRVTMGDVAKNSSTKRVDCSSHAEFGPPSLWWPSSVRVEGSGSNHGQAQCRQKYQQTHTTATFPTNDD